MSALYWNMDSATNKEVEEFLSIELRPFQGLSFRITSNKIIPAAMIYVFLHCYQDNDYIAVLKVFGVFMKVMMMRIDRDGWPWPKQQVRVHFFVEVWHCLSVKMKRQKRDGQKGEPKRLQ